MTSQRRSLREVSFMAKLHHDSNCQMTDPGEIQETEAAVSRVPKDLSNIRFVPWIGRKYGRSGLFADKRIMILGESHYEWCELCAKNGTPRGKDLTCWCVAELVVGKTEYKQQHWRKIEYALTGKYLEQPRRAEFWSSVVYYNYVQEIVGLYPEAGRAPPPTRQMWEEAKPLFLEVLKSLSPDLVIVLGFGLWTKLPDEGPDGQLPPINEADKELERCRYHIGRKDIIACRVRHPAAGLGSTWYPVLRTTIANL